MTDLELPAGTFRVRRATREDLPSLVALLRDDPLGATRESAPDEDYLRAFEAVDGDPAHYLAAVTDPAGDLSATLQLTLLPGLSRGGSTRLQVEGVRVAAAHRGAGLGAALLDWAHAWGRDHGAVVAQLTTDRSRGDAHRFYERLGYTPSHVGFKRPLR